MVKELLKKYLLSCVKKITRKYDSKNSGLGSLAQPDKKE